MEGVGLQGNKGNHCLKGLPEVTQKYVNFQHLKIYNSKWTHGQNASQATLKKLFTWTRSNKEGSGGRGGLGKMVDTSRGVCWRQNKKMQSSSTLENTQETISKLKTAVQEVSKFVHVKRSTWGLAGLARQESSILFKGFVVGKTVKCKLPTC